MLHGSKPLSFVVFNAVQQATKNCDKIVETQMFNDAFIRLTICSQATESIAGIFGATIVHVLFYHVCQRGNKLFGSTDSQYCQTSLLIITNSTFS